MKTIDENIEKIMDEISKKTNEFDQWITFYKDGEALDYTPAGTDKESKISFLKEFIKDNGLEHDVFESADFEDNGKGGHFVNVHFISTPRLVYKVGNLYIEEISKSNKIEFTPEIDEAFDFANWTYKELFFCEFFQKSAGSFSLKAGKKGWIKPQFF